MKKTLVALIIMSSISSVFARSYVINDKQSVPELSIIGFSYKECDDKVENLISKLESKNSVILDRSFCKQDLKSLPAVRFEGKIVFY